VPAIAESGVPGFDVSGWACLMAPALIVRKLNAAMRQALAQKEVIEAFTQAGARRDAIVIGRASEPNACGAEEEMGESTCSRR
jgi:tripartite-type tricarboxylate transporter receptor subunit TctC